MQARRPWNLVAGLGSSGWEKSPVLARLWVHKSLVLCYSASLSLQPLELKNGQQEQVLFSCNVILVFNIIFIVFRNNIYYENFSSSKTLPIWSRPFFHPNLHPFWDSTFRKTGSDWDLQIQNIWCPLLLLPSTSSEDLQLRHVLPYKHSTWHDVNTKKKDNDRSHR